MKNLDHIPFDSVVMGSKPCIRGVLPQDLSHGEVNARVGTAAAHTGAIDAFLRSVDAA